MKTIFQVKYNKIVAKALLFTVSNTLFRSLNI